MHPPTGFDATPIKWGAAGTDLVIAREFIWEVFQEGPEWELSHGGHVNPDGKSGD